MQLILAKHIKFISVIIFIIISISCKKEVKPEIYDYRVEPYKIIDEKFRVGSRLSISNDNRVIRSITLPHRALYWSYWLGVGEDPVKALAKIAVPAAMSKLTEDPFIAYGWKALSALNTIQLGSGNVDLYFCDGVNKTKFVNEDVTFAPYPFFQCPQAVTSYAIRETMTEPILHDSTFYATFRNMSPTNGLDVTFKVYAYIMKE